MTTRERWDETRALIEAGQTAFQLVPGTDWCVCGYPALSPCDSCKRAIAPTDWDDTKQAQHDGSRQIYGDAGKFMRGGEPG